VSPPWFGNRACEDNPHTFAHDHRADNQERLASAHRGRSNVTVPEFAGVRSAVSQTFMQTPLQVRFRGTTEGLHPRSSSRAFARRRDCDFSDVQTHNQR